MHVTLMILATDSKRRIIHHTAPAFRYPRLQLPHIARKSIRQPTTPPRLQILDAFVRPQT
jgi:hypothetical protein